PQLKLRGRVVVRDDHDRADAQDAVQEGLVELDVLDVPELQRVDVLGQQPAFEIDAVVTDPVTNRLRLDHRDEHEDDADHNGDQYPYPPDRVGRLREELQRDAGGDERH